MMQTRVHCSFVSPSLRHYRSLVTNALANQEEYNRLARYPEIKDISAKARKVEKNEAYHEEVKQLNTVEEKLIKLNMPKYYGFKCIMLHDKKFPYNSLPMSQYACRTHFEELADLSVLFGKNIQEKSASFKTRIIKELEETIAFEADCRRSHSGLDNMEKERQSNSLLVQQLNRTILNALAAEHPHTANVQIDLEPRHEAFWFVGGIPPLTIVQKNREGRKLQKDSAKEPIDRPFQYIGSPYLALRHKSPLEPFRETKLDAMDLGVDKVEIPEYKYDPRTLGYGTSYRHGTTVPGFWPGSPHEFGLLSYQSRDHFKLRSKILGSSDVDWPEALQSQVTEQKFMGEKKNLANFISILGYPVEFRLDVRTSLLSRFFHIQRCYLPVHHPNHYHGWPNVVFLWLPAEHHFAALPKRRRESTLQHVLGQQRIKTVRENRQRNGKDNWTQRRRSDPTAAFLPERAGRAEQPKLKTLFGRMRPNRSRH
jgi:Mitochondrial 28S ribosomal protein S30 (PDCD9)